MLFIHPFQSLFIQHFIHAIPTSFSVLIHSTFYSCYSFILFSPYSCYILFMLFIHPFQSLFIQHFIHTIYSSFSVPIHSPIHFLFILHFIYAIHSSFSVLIYSSFHVTRFTTSEASGCKDKKNYKVIIETRNQVLKTPKFRKEYLFSRGARRSLDNLVFRGWYS